MINIINHIIFFNSMFFLLSGLAATILLLILYFTKKNRIIRIAAAVLVLLQVNILFIAVSYYMINIHGLMVVSSGRLLKLVSSLFNPLVILLLTSLIQELFGAKQKWINPVKYSATVMLGGLFVLVSFFLPGQWITESHLSFGLALVMIILSITVIVHIKETAIPEQHRIIPLFYAFFFILFSIFVLFYTYAKAMGGSEAPALLFQLIDLANSLMGLTLTFSIIVFSVRAIVSQKSHTDFEFTKSATVGISKAFREEFRITPREEEVIRLIQQSHSNEEIARELEIATNTVKVMIYNIFRKVRIKSRVELINAIIKSKSDPISYR